MSELTQNLESKLKTYRMTQDEYQRMKQLLGREPNQVEWPVFSALWSEHCSYKSSKVHLKKFYNKNNRVLESFGENAGVIDLGEGERVAFKMESHNHPSFISPHQGAATGVGGILRDIFTMGARPVALANYLCFGSPEEKVMPHLVDGVVRGIADYGNCVGVPMITGSTEFNDSYNGNILVNALAVGYFAPGEPLVTSGVHGVGNKVVYVGAKTGRDGVHGASMASESFDEENEAKKPTVQIGDPFFEKLLIESCLEVIQMNLVEAIQDMGAAGLTSSSFEMSAKGGLGLKMDLSQVPLREEGLSPEEILLSESQERMLLICKPENVEKLQGVFKKWDLDAEVVGEVLPTKEVELFWKGELLTKIDPEVVVENAPEYDRPFEVWSSSNKTEALEPMAASADFLNDSFKHIQISSKEWIFRQYDQRVGAQTALDCSESIGAVRLPHSGRALGLALGCRPPVMRTDIEVGAFDAIAYPCLQLSSKGFEPLATTDCLNFGNPEKAEVMTEFVSSVERMSEACESFDVPVVSGNVSLYNETLDKNVTSTPSTGIVGLKEDINTIPSDRFCFEGESVILLRLPLYEGLFFNAEVFDRPRSFSGQWQGELAAGFAKKLREWVNSSKPTTSVVVGKGGALVELQKMSQGGFSVDLKENQAKEFTLERLYEVIVTTNDPETFMAQWGTDFHVELLGQTQRGAFKIDGVEALPGCVQKTSDLQLQQQLGLE